ncbi:MAG: methyltransferase domain-containing protein [Candidatus Gracilibacteria bacterium]|jgi:ubiquinone/menaquinone biosynthesis C-methylase UbiE
MREKTAKKILKKVVEDYDNISEEFSQTRENYFWEDFEEIAPYLKDNALFADLGCGNGRLYKFINSKNNKITYIGIDNNKNFLKRATDKYHANFIYGDLIHLPLESNSVDIAAAIASIHHLPSKKLRKESLKEIHRILRNSGTFVITVWNLFKDRYKKYIWQSRLRKFYTFGKYDLRDTFIPWSKSGVKRHYYAFKPEELKRLLEESGFEIIKETANDNILFICKKKK